MTDNQVVELYMRAVGEHPPCREKDDELGAWKEVLNQFTYSQLDAALRRWLVDTTIEEYTGRPRGSRMPTATELRASILDFERTQNSIASGKFRACGKNGCEGGFVPVGSQVTEKIDTRRRTSCQCRLDYIRQKKGLAA